MDNDAPATPPTEPLRLPAADLPAPREAPESQGVFRALVKEDSDIAGLIAYSIYKQNKLDWLSAFETAKGRAPDDKEFVAYIMGEGTPRRLATYRHLAEATLAGTGPNVDGVAASVPSIVTAGPAARRAMTTRLFAAYALIGILSLVILWMAVRYAIAAR